MVAIGNSSTLNFAAPVYILYYEVVLYWCVVNCVAAVYFVSN